MSVKVHKLTLMVLDFEGTKDGDIQHLIERNKYLNISVMDHEKLEKGIEWEDDNPLNLLNKRKEEFERLFREEEVEKVV